MSELWSAQYKEPLVAPHHVTNLLPSAVAERSLHRFTLKEYHWLIEQGFFQPEDRVELIEGFLVERSSIHPPHAATMDWLTEEFVVKVRRQAKVRIQQPITLPEQVTEPEPDFALARRMQEYRTHHPLPVDLLLVGEVSDSTLACDRNKKARFYAAARIAEYWIVNLIDNVLEVYRDPMGSGDNANYQVKLTYTADKKVAPQALPDCIIDLSTTFLRATDELL
ncbi:MAG: Uma2 family endonuclease [Caldilineaceae bacterium]